MVLAAGAGSRFAGPDHKLLAPLRGRPVVVWAVTAALDAGLAETIVVSGAVDLGPVLADHGLADRVRVVVNPAWADGQATSLAAGIATVDAAGHDAAVVGLADQPLVAAEAWRLVATRRWVGHDPSRWPPTTGADATRCGCDRDRLAAAADRG